jgi:hypothetical protein
MSDRLGRVGAAPRGCLSSAERSGPRLAERGRAGDRTDPADRRQAIRGVGVAVWLTPQS